MLDHVNSNVARSLRWDGGGAWPPRPRTPRGSATGVLAAVPGPSAAPRQPADGDGGVGYLGGGSSGTRRQVLALILAVHAALLVALVVARHNVPAKPATAIEVVNITLPPPRVAPAAPPQTTEVRLAEPLPPTFTVADPVVTLPAPPAFAAPPRSPSPEAPARIEAAAASPPVSTIVTADDLGTRMTRAAAPRYPVESRRRCEQGEVILDAVVDERGRIASLGVARSSGHARLDTAALRAVEGWQWAPLIRAGRAVSVRGQIAIPFVLSNASTRC